METANQACMQFVYHAMPSFLTVSSQQKNPLGSLHLTLQTLPSKSSIWPVKSLAILLHKTRDPLCHHTYHLFPDRMTYKPTNQGQTLVDVVNKECTSVNQTGSDHHMTTDWLLRRTTQVLVVTEKNCCCVLFSIFKLTNHSWRQQKGNQRANAKILFQPSVTATYHFLITLWWPKKKVATNHTPPSVSNTLL